MSDIFDRRDKALKLLVQYRQAIERIAETGVPLTNADFDLVSLCLQIILDDLAMQSLMEIVAAANSQGECDEEEGVACAMRYDDGRNDDGLLPPSISDDCGASRPYEDEGIHWTYEPDYPPPTYHFDNGPN